MNIYAIVLFFHVLGALGFFAAIGLEWVALFQARRALTSEQVREWLRLARASYRLGMPSMITLLLSGGYMGMTVWHGVPWLLVSVGALVLLVVVVLVFISPRLRAIGRTLAAEAGTNFPTLSQQLHQPQLWLALQIRLAIALGIVYLMTIKPDLTGSLLALAVFVGLGLVSALPLLGQPRPQPQAG
jgi:hypothetical protein